MKRRNVTITAAMTAILSAPLIVAAPSAQADELSDLRANQELLQRRLDQLAQSQNPGAGSILAPTGGGPVTVQMRGGSFPRSFLIPGTDTSIRVGGEARLNIFYWVDGGNPNVQHQTNGGATGQLNTIPLSQSGSARIKGENFWSQSMAQSKVSFETRTPSAWGEARTFIEFDFANVATGTRPLAISDNIIPRTRYAYGTLGGWLAGQANSNFSDSDAGLETISFSGLTGGPGVARIPQLRYTAPLAGWGLPGALSFSAETPETDWWAPARGVEGQYNVTATPLTSAGPDITAAWYIPQPWGHVDFSAVLRPTLQVKDGLFVDRNFVGWGVHFSGDVKPRWFGWDRDYIVWNVNAGDAIGRYIGSGSGNSTIALVSNYPAASPASAAAAAGVLIKPVWSWGGNVGYRRQWTPALRSNLGIGVYHEDVNGLRGQVCSNAPANLVGRQTGAAGCGLNKETVNVAVNLLWAPVAFVDVGIEYMWGHRLTIANQRGDENMIGTIFKVKF